MSEENVELVRRAKEAFNRGEREGALRYFAEDVEWVHPLDPFTGRQTFRGHAELLAFWARLDGQWDEFRSEAKEYIDAGERVVVPGRVTGRGRTSGATPSMLEVEVLTVSGGRITRRESYADLAHALEAVGPTERRT
jgi:ketosteroid isomerase-like protein